MPRQSLPMRRRRHQRRRAFTLLEIVLGMAIFFGALAIFSQILWNGSRAAVQSQLRSQALVRCEAKLGEVVAGAVAFQSQQNQAFSSDAIDQNWTWTVDIQPTSHPNLNNVVVSVEHLGNSGISNASVQLHRWMRDPAQMALVAMEAAKQAEENKLKAEEAKAAAEEQAAQTKNNGGGTNQGKTKRGIGDSTNGPNPKGGEGNPKGGGPKGGGGGPKGGGGGPKGGGGLPPGFPPGLLPPGFNPNNIPPGLIPPGGFPPGLIPPGLIPPGGTPKGQ